MGGRGSKPSGEGNKPTKISKSDATRQDPSRAGDDFGRKNRREEEDKETNYWLNRNMEAIPSMAGVTFPPMARLRDSAAILDTTPTLTLYCNVCIGAGALRDQPNTAKQNNFKNLECTSCNAKFASSSVKEETITEEYINDAKASDRDLGGASTDHKLFPYMSDTSSFTSKEKGIAKDIDVSKTFSCVVCNRRFGNASALGDHQLSHVSDKSASDSKAASTAQNSKATEMFPCNVCSRSFGSASALGDHQRSHASGGAELENKKSIDCSICGRKFGGISALKEHQRAKHPTPSEENFDCSVCDRKFGSNLESTSNCKKPRTGKSHQTTQTRQ